MEWALLHLGTPFAHFGATRDSALGLAVLVLIIFVCLLLVPEYAWQVRVTSRLLVEQAQVAPRMEERRQTIRARSAEVPIILTVTVSASGIQGGVLPPDTGQSSALQ